MKGDNDETHENINHKKGNDDNINEIKTGNYRPVVVNRTMVYFIRINRNVKNAESKKKVLFAQTIGSLERPEYYFIILNIKIFLNIMYVLTWASLQMWKRQIT